ncbi:coproporphyrinogen-III oxidase family protein [Elusimicrobiota bacterium]
MIEQELINQAKNRIQEYYELQKEGLINLKGTFFPSVHYPPITMYPPIKEKALFKDYKNPTDNLFDIYVHIPFCIKYCNFCHYPIKIKASSEEKDYYLDMLEKEIDIYLNRLGYSRINGRAILIGGGTPTHLSPCQLSRFLKSFSKRVEMSTCTQFSYDVDPTTLLGEEGREKLKIMKDYGVDRLTIGIQSFNDRTLKIMNRAHNAKEAVESVQRSKKMGYKVNLEFIYGYISQSLEQWMDTIKKAVSLEVDEIQFYQLKVIPYGDHNGLVLKEYDIKTEEFPKKERTLMMKSLAISYLTQNGYSENLTRVFSRTKQDYSHYADNQCCKLFSQLGFGLTGFSSLHDRFGLNTLSLKRYYAMIEQGKLPVDRGLVRNEDDQLRWGIILPLKNREVLKKYYQRLTGISLDKIFRKKISRLKEFNLLYENEVMLKLTPLGRFFADEVCHQFHHPRFMPFPKDEYAEGKLYPFDNYKPYA